MKRLSTIVMTATLTLSLAVSASAQSNEPIEPIKAIEPTELIELSESQNAEIKPLVEITPLATYNINWSVGAGKISKGVSQFSMNKGNTITFDLKWSPEPGVVTVGLVDTKTGRYYPIKNSNSSPFKGTVAAPHTGVFSFAMENTSSRSAISVTGSFTY